MPPSPRSTRREDRPDGFVRHFLPSSPPRGNGIVFQPVEADLVARVGSVLRHERIQELSRGETCLIEIGIRREGREALAAIAEARAARIAALGSSPREGGRRLPGDPNWKNSSRELNVSGRGVPDRRRTWCGPARREGQGLGATAN